MSAGTMPSGKRLRLRHPAVVTGAVAVVVVVLAGYLALTHRQRPPAVTDVPAQGSAQNQRHSS